MAWLRDLMSSADPRIKSYGELARLCLECDDWPRDIQPQSRSLASLFSKFDRGIEVEWLDDRPEVQFVLGQVLNVSPRAVEVEVRKQIDRAVVHPLRYRLADAPATRPMDLRFDALPPHVPQAVQRPGLWTRQWWDVDEGDLPDVAGRWLRARELAQYLVCGSWEELEPHLLSGSGPLFVELTAPLANRDWSGIDLARPVCVAGPPPLAPGFEPLRSPPAQERVDELLDWLEPLLLDDQHVERAVLKPWLASLFSQRLTCSAASVIGLASLAHAQPEIIERVSTPRSLADLLVNQALERAEQDGSSEVPWLREHCLEVLRGMSKRALLESDTNWNAPRTQAEWLALVPQEYQKGVDAEWTRLSLARAGSPLTVADLEKALKAVPPGGFRVVSALIAARLLRGDDGNGFRFGPQWFSDLIKRWGQETVLDGAAFEWGEVALLPRHFDWLLAALCERVRSGNLTVLDAALELDDDETAGLVLAIEMLVVACGQAVLTGQELEPEQVLGLLRLQSDLALTGGDIATPRLLTTNNNPILYGEWLLGAWALSEQLESPEAVSSFALNPWLEQAPLSATLLDGVTDALAQLPAEHPFVDGAYALLGRLLQHRESEPSTFPTDETQPLPDLPVKHPVFSVARVLRSEGWSAWEQVQQTPHGVHSVHSLVAPEAWPYLAKAAWRSWLEHGQPQSGDTLFAGDGPHADLFWPHLPDRVLRQLLDSKAPIVLTVPGQSMKDEWITMYLERVPEEAELAIRYLELIPMQQVSEEHFEVLFELLETHGMQDRVETIWSSHLAAALMHVTRYLDQGKQTQSQVWLRSAPHPAREALLAHLTRQLEAHGASYPSFDTCREWLHQLCVARVPGWQACYELLSETEQRLKRANRARKVS